MSVAVPEFCPARPADVEAVVRLVESAYRGDSSRAGWTTEADLLDGQRTDGEEVACLIRDPEARLLLAHIGQELVGCVLARVSAHSPVAENDPAALHERVAHIGMFAVRPTLQSRGLGSALLEHAERVARAELGAARAELTVIEQRADLLPWYERRGYRRTGATEPFPYGNPRFGLPRRPDLRFLVLAKSL
ncbi:MAG TPA: GNAT family N-acetyltransferase [Polyangiaceae bacterium]|jgi:ribosomal protein S18 acetylase RimI-like enzyme|nr:GNAT family N-acetyltransferase [Polyangiaceae bacterium]